MWRKKHFTNIIYFFFHCYDHITGGSMVMACSAQFFKHLKAVALCMSSFTHY